MYPKNRRIIQFIWKTVPFYGDPNFSSNPSSSLDEILLAPCAIYTDDVYKLSHHIQSFLNGNKYKEEKGGKREKVCLRVGERERERNGGII